MRVQLHAEASAELVAEHDFYERRLDGLGAELEQEVDRALGMIAAMPHAWEAWPGLPEVRVFPLERFPFVLPYWVGEGTVVLLALAHVKKRPGYWRDRLRDV